MGASGHSRRSAIDEALDNASRALRITEDESSESESVTPIQKYQKRIAGKRREVNTYRELLSCQLQIIGQQQHFLESKDESIRELQDQIVKLKEKVSNLEKTANNVGAVNEPIRNSESKEKRLLRSKTYHEKGDSENNMTLPDLHPLDCEDVARPNAVSANVPSMRRATRTSTAERHSTRRPSSSSSISDAAELCNEYSPSKSRTLVDKRIPSPKKPSVPAAITSSRLRNPSISSKARSTSPANSSDPEPLNDNPKKLPRTKLNDRLGSDQCKPQTTQLAPSTSEKQIKSSKSTSTFSCTPEKVKDKNKEIGVKRTSRAKSDLPDERRTTRNQSSEVVASNIRSRRDSSTVRFNPPNSKRVKERPPERLIWESPLILNETENCLTTRIHYHTLERDEELMDSSFKSLQLLPQGDSDNSFNVEVPSWREKVIAKSTYASGIEDLDDSVFLKRHQKLELDERRRKRWDAQRLREEQYLVKLKSRSDRRDQSKAYKRRIASMGDSEEGALETFINEIETFQPKLQGATCIRVEDDLPISVFGFPIPLVEPCEFELPWELKPRRPKRSRNEVYYKSSYGNRHT